MILKWENGRYYAITMESKLAERERPLGEVVSHRDIIQRIKSLINDGLQINGAKLRFGMHGDGLYNPYLDITASHHPQSGLVVSPSMMRNGDVVILVAEDRSLLPGHVSKNGRRTTIDLPWEQEKGKRFFVLDEGGNGVITATLGCDGDHVRAIPSVSVRSWLSSECPLACAKYALDETRKSIRCPCGRLLESEDGEPFSDDDIVALNRAGLAGILGKRRLRRARQCQG